jgi:hypothetical protein
VIAYATDPETSVVAVMMTAERRSR